jgi:hypothetical protein
MKTQDKAKEYTEKQYYKVDDVDEFNGEPLAVYRAYKQCQEDNKNKKFTEEDLFNAFNAGIDCEFGGAPSFDVWIKEYIKQYEKK